MLGIGPCAGCQAKDQTIEILRDQLRQVNEEKGELQKSMIALSDLRAASIRFPKPPEPHQPSEPIQTLQQQRRQIAVISSVDAPVQSRQEVEKSFAS
jgi:hypothetical protein